MPLPVDGYGNWLLYGLRSAPTVNDCEYVVFLCRWSLKVLHKVHRDLKRNKCSNAWCDHFVAAFEVLLISKGVWLDCGRGQVTADFTFAAFPGFVLWESKVDNSGAKSCMGPKISLKVFRSIYRPICYYFKLCTWQFGFHWDCVFIR